VGIVKIKVKFYRNKDEVIILLKLILIIFNLLKWLKFQFLKYLIIKPLSNLNNIIKNNKKIMEQKKRR